MFTVKIQIMLLIITLLEAVNFGEGLTVFLGIIAFLLLIKFFYYAIIGGILGVIVSEGIGIPPETCFMWGAIIFGIAGLFHEES